MNKHTFGDTFKRAWVVTDNSTGEIVSLEGAVAEFKIYDSSEKTILTRTSATVSGEFFITALEGRIDAIINDTAMQLPLGDYSFSCSIRYEDGTKQTVEIANFEMVSNKRVKEYE